MVRYANKQFHEAKGHMFDVVDGLTDAQRDIVSTEKYINKQLGLMNKRLGQTEWKFQMKYGTRVTSKCTTDAERTTSQFDKLKKESTAMRKAFATMSNGFVASAGEDLKLWDCDKMYPKPKRTTMDWWELVTGTAKKGFEIFNQVKGLIPGGDVGAGGSIPGLPAGISNMIPGMGGKEYFDFEEELMMEGFFGGDTDATWRKRQQIWGDAIKLCRSERGKFEDALEKI